jgi:predicted PurR-regulated permease PerM
MSIIEQTLTAYVRGVMIAGLILGLPLFIALFIDTVKLTKGDNN